MASGAALETHGLDGLRLPLGRRGRQRRLADVRLGGPAEQGAGGGGQLPTEHLDHGLGVEAEGQRPLAGPLEHGLEAHELPPFDDERPGLEPEDAATGEAAAGDGDALVEVAARGGAPVEEDVLQLFRDPLQRGVDPTEVEGRGEVIQLEGDVVVEAGRGRLGGLLRLPLGLLHVGRGDPPRLAVELRPALQGEGGVHVPVHEGRARRHPAEVRPVGDHHRRVVARRTEHEVGRARDRDRAEEARVLVAVVGAGGLIEDDNHGGRGVQHASVLRRTRFAFTFRGRFSIYNHPLGGQGQRELAFGRPAEKNFGGIPLTSAT